MLLEWFPRLRHTTSAFCMVYMICLPCWPVHPWKSHEKWSRFMSTYMRTCQSHITSSISRCGCSVDKLSIIQLIQLSGLFFLHLPPQLVLMVAAFTAVRAVNVAGLSLLFISMAPLALLKSTREVFSVLSLQKSHVVEGLPELDAVVVSTV